MPGQPATVRNVMVQETECRTLGFHPSGPKPSGCFGTPWWELFPSKASCLENVPAALEVTR